MDFQQAVKTCLMKKYADFSGRATRPEFWWFVLAQFLASETPRWAQAVKASRAKPD